jgi:hypothetical protein
MYAIVMNAEAPARTIIRLQFANEARQSLPLIRQLNNAQSGEE